MPDTVLAKIQRRIRREGMLDASRRAGVAVSGGADSVALLHALRELDPDRQLVAVHLNHCLRGAESDADEDFVRATAGRIGIRCLVRRQDVGALARAEGSNLELAGRQCRYRFFTSLVADGACDVVATAHTRSDQAETVLFRLLRGSGGGGLSAIRPRLDGGIVRPMLDVSRGEVLEYLRERGIPWREDASNADPAFARNRIRHDLLPALRHDWNPSIESTLARTSEWALEEERYWRLRTAEHFQLCVRAGRHALLLDIDAARRLHAAELRRLIISILRHPLVGGGAAGFAHVEACCALIRSASGSGAVDLPGARAERSFRAIRFRAAETSGARAAPFDLPLPVPGLAALPCGAGTAVRARVVRSVETRALYNGGDAALLDWERVPRPLRVRNWQPGDRYRPAGTVSQTKIKDLFQRDQVSRWDRPGWPVVTAAAAGSEPARIVWSRGFGPAQDLAAGPGSRRVLALDEVRGAPAPPVPESRSPASHTQGGASAAKDPQQ